MKHFTLKVDYEIGFSFEIKENAYTIIGYEHVQERGIRYVCMKNDATDWQYLYSFEIKVLLNKGS